MAQKSKAKSLAFEPEQLPVLRTALLAWYGEHARELPWRKNRDPYRIWISEVMLQQTTVTAVIPFYERFMVKFPHVKALARAPIEEVLQLWSGLGYYSRARNLHSAAQAFAKKGFPKDYVSLLEFKGFGPYTARAVSSLAFSEPVGVLDGNVIRVLSRVHGQAVEWWSTQGRKTLQDISDLWNSEGPSDQINQALMELGSTVCTPQSPSCMICPLFKNCGARKSLTVDQVPLKRARRAKEIWIWQPHLSEKQKKIALVKNDYAPFLKGQWILPGRVERATRPPKNYKFKHMITHHEIYVVPPKNSVRSKTKNEKWIEPEKIHELNPTSFLQKTLRFMRAER